MRKEIIGGFSEDGRRYVVRDVHFIDRADTDLWNDSMRIQIDQRGRVWAAGFLQPNLTEYSGTVRAFYVRDDVTGKFWSAPYEPVHRDPDRFEFSIGLGDVKWSVTLDGLRVDLQLVVPRDDSVELWSASVTNVTRRRRRVSLYSYFPVGVRGLLAQESRFDERLGGALHAYFPYYVHYADYYKLRGLANNVFCVPDRRPVGCQLSVADFVGTGGLHDPEQLHRTKLAGPPAPLEVSNERATSVFQFRFDLAPGKSRSVNLVFGPARDRNEARRLSGKYLAKGAMGAACARVYKFLEAHAPSVRVETPDHEFDSFLNHWQSRRSLMLARTIRFNYAPQGRNVIQDAMGGTYVDPTSSRKWFLRIWGHQHCDGWLPHGMPFAEGVQQIEINSIPHKDINSWGPTSLSFYMYETGDFSILNEKIPFADAPRRKATLYEHVCLGLDWLLRDRTRRGLCRIGQGDWNDPLNMAGIAEKGESIWLTEALAHALDVWAEVADWCGDERRAGDCRVEAGSARRAVNRYGWDGRWYARGFTDAGRAFGVGSDREGKIYLNAQSWAMICGAAGPNEQDSCIRGVERLLMTPSGPMTLAPPYSRMREDVGKLTQKIPGWNENSSVYCHAATFYAYALYCVRRPDEAFDVLRRLVPGFRGNSVGRTGQLPLFVPNFYRGDASGRKAGRSSHGPNTGTASWYYRTAIAMLMGVRAERDGLRIDPQLPGSWPKARVRRDWRGARFDIAIRRSRKTRETTVLLDGKRLPGSLVPVQPAGTRHSVEVTIPFL